MEIKECKINIPQFLFGNNKKKFQGQIMLDNQTNMRKNDLTYTNTQSSSQVHLLQYLCRITYLTG